MERYFVETHPPNLCVFVSFSPHPPPGTSNTERRMVRIAAPSSRSDHRRAHSSPRRAPVSAPVASKAAITGSPLSASATIFSTSSAWGVSGSWDRIGGGLARRATERSTQPHLSPWCSAATEERGRDERMRGIAVVPVSVAGYRRSRGHTRSRRATRCHRTRAERPSRSTGDIP